MSTPIQPAMTAMDVTFNGACTDRYVVSEDYEIGEGHELVANTRGVLRPGRYRCTGYRWDAFADQTTFKFMDIP